MVERDTASRATRRGRAIAPWVVAAVVLATVVSGVTFGYLWVTARCGGTPVQLAIAASPDQVDVVQGLAKKWQAQAPEINGRCAQIEVRSEQSAQVASSLTTNWKAGSGGPRTDVWMPDSSVWINSAATRADARSMVSGQRTRVASSPVVMALPQPMAQALGWPNTAISWSKLASARVTSVTWAKFQHPEWGQIQIGVGNPQASFAALGTLLSVADANGDNVVAETELSNALVLSRSVSMEATTSDTFLATMTKVTDIGAGLRNSGPFPATERQVAAYDNAKPKVPLVAVNPDEGTVVADYPYLVLKADWVDATRQQVARQFLTYLQSDNSQKVYGQAGFRDAGQSTRYSLGLNPDLGMGSQSATTNRDLPDIQSINKTVGFWTALGRQANLLAVIDTSGSMSEKAPDGSGSRIAVVQQACLRADALFSAKSDVGSWKFSTNLDGRKPYKVMVPIGPVGGTLPDGTPRRKALDNAVYKSLIPGGATGLYDTLFDAYKFMQARWEGGGRLNLVVMLTDGQNENPGGLTQGQLIGKLKAIANPDKPVQVLIIGFGPDTNLRELTNITSAVGGHAYPARTGADIQKVFLATLTGAGS